MPLQTLSGFDADKILAPLCLRSVFVCSASVPQPSHSLWNGRVWQGLRVLLVHDLEEALENEQSESAELLLL